MDKFAEYYNAMKQAYDQKEYEETLVHLRQMRENGAIPMEKEWMYHQAAGLTLFWLGEMYESLYHLQQVWMKPGDMTLATQQRSYSNYLMYLHYLPGITDEQMCTEHFRYAELFCAVRPFSHEKRNKKKLRIGYLSPDFVDHIVTNFSVQLFACYDRSRYEVVLYSTGTRRNEVTEWLAHMVNGYRDLSALDAQAAASQIYEDHVDILFDLSGQTEGGQTLQIAAWKPAPLQICGIGYFDTTGLPAMDYFLSDIYCDPPNNDHLFMEKLIRLPHSHLCFTPSQQFQGISMEYQVHDPFIFGSFNNFAKVTDNMLVIWLRILNSVPGSQLIMKNVSPRREPIERMRKRALKLGYNPEQLDLRPATPDYLKDYQEIDIVLDTYPYPGGGTTCEALYMGIPVINLRGTRHGARFGYSLLKNIGLEELSAATPEEYADCAIALAKQPGLLQGLHERLRTMMQNSPIMQGNAYVVEIEHAYEKIWADWLQR